MKKIMYYTYILHSPKFKQWYIGYSSDLRKRLKDHKDGKVQSTKHFTPWNMVYYEAYSDKMLAQNRELKLKHHGKAFSSLKKRIVLPIE